MSLNDFKERYDSFQKDAVQSIVNDFNKKKNGRYLLVIPTAGGKTFTAVKAICQLFDQNVLDLLKDKILWMAHRKELLIQAKETFHEFIENSHTATSIEKNIILSMISKATEELSHNSNIKIVVIDEAHHGAAMSYQPIFNKNSIGILGLTATPSRHDGKPLDFERESYSIGFPDLVKKGIILNPKIHTIEGDRYDIKSFDEDDLEKLNNEKRNLKIINELSDHTEEYKKIIIYVGTTKHAEELYNKLLKTTTLKDKYESISYITGEGNSRDQNREEFIETEKKYKRSILVNVQVLSEGYDDPVVNTVIMASPTKSKLYYMQALGRAIRRNPDDSLKIAHVIEVVDELPNIRYRIDNRWLYADISDTLEPAVIDISFSSNKEFTERLKEIYLEYNVLKNYHIYPEFNDDLRYSIMMFKQYRGPSDYINLPILITNENRVRVSNMFNFISERMASFRNRQIHFEAVFRMLGRDGTGLIADSNERHLVYDAMGNASIMCHEETNINEFIKSGKPWLTFIALNYRKRDEDFSEDLLKFIADMVNKEDILELLITKNYEKDSVLIRLPLPLDSYVGKIVTNSELSDINSIVDKLQQIKKTQGNVDHRSAVNYILQDSVLPIEIKHSDSLLLIVRESINFFYPLT